MEFDEFEPILRAELTKQAELDVPEGVRIIDAIAASDDDLNRAEEAVNAELPRKYKEFMEVVGGGLVVGVDLLPVVSTNPRISDLLSACTEEFPSGNFLPISNPGTGDWWGFLVIDGRCSDQVFQYNRDTGDFEVTDEDFLTFLVRVGVRHEL
ncbi:MAG: SMI1/KNR4 family protein [Hamadaea sp.]|uniref:SMI1/KNR4 family protein n=1 Tax=Hamadaea sp. TaxID=2024425 RepID=UPI0017E53639|nr:SMI1/KNR4 family protein [Hamadaea sp.]NUT20446.1 SMI1/KNR4 family protein [Hamadaea sp.]